LRVRALLPLQSKVVRCSLSVNKATNFFSNSYHHGHCLRTPGAHNDQRLPYMEKLTLYLKESYHELVQNVSWPTSQQLQESTIVVLITSGILALIIFLMDVLSSLVFKTIYGIM
jgi:preprotein translocase subunit SecE